MYNVNHLYDAVHGRYYYDRAFVSDDFNYRRVRTKRESNLLDMHVRRGERDMELNRVIRVEGGTSVAKVDHSMDGRLARITQKQEEEAKKVEDVLSRRRAEKAARADASSYKNDALERYQKKQDEVIQDAIISSRTFYKIEDKPLPKYKLRYNK